MCGRQKKMTGRPSTRKIGRVLGMDVLRMLQRTGHSADTAQEGRVGLKEDADLEVSCGCFFQQRGSDWAPSG